MPSEAVARRFAARHATCLGVVPDMSLGSLFDVEPSLFDPTPPIRAAIAITSHRPSLPCDPRELWSQLVEGTLRITDHFTAAKRCYLVAAIRPAHEVEGARLTLRELAVLTSTLLGAQQKVTAFDLEIAPSTVASHLAQALLKLDLIVPPRDIPLALVLVCQAACGDARPGDERVTALQHTDGGHVIASRACPEKRLPGLTAAEQAVAIALAAGATKGEIARARLTSVNTIGKQISSLYAKLGVTGRFDLVRLMTEEGGAPG